MQSIVEYSRRPGLRSADTADYVKHRLEVWWTLLSVTLVRLPGTHYLAASSC